MRKQSKKDVMEKRHILTKKDVTKSWFLWWFSVEVANSFERLQGLAVCISMIPSLKKLYKKGDDFNAALKRHLQFFNTESTWGGITLGIALAMEEQKAMGEDIPDEMINSIKTGLMGPFAGIGDTINWATLVPILLGLFIPVAKSGSWIAGIAPITIFVIITLIIGYNSYHLGYRLGMKSATQILQAGWINQLILGASILGMFMMGGLAAGYVDVSTGLKISIGGMKVALQKDVLDQILPGLLPLLTVSGVYLFLEKVKRNYSLVAVILLAIGLILGGLGILQAPVS